MSSQDKPPNSFTIIWDHYCPRVADVGSKNKFSWSQFFWYGLLPLAIAFLLIWRIGSFPLSSIDSLIAVLSIVVTVLTATLGQTQALVSRISLPSGKGKENARRRKRQLIRLASLRRIYSAIAFAILVLLIALICAILARSGVGDDLAMVFSFVIYTASAVAGIVFYDLVVHLYVVLDEQAAMIESGLDDNHPADTAE